MAGLYVLIVGCPAEKKDELSEHLWTYARRIMASQHAEIAPEVEEDLVQKSAAVVCFATGPASRSRVVEVTRRWASLYPDTPVVIHGLADPVLPAERTGRVYLGPNAPLKTLAEEVGRLVFDGSESQLGIPRVVVNLDGKIIYANGKALLEFPASDPGLVGQPYHRAIEGATDSALPEDHPIRVVIQQRELVSRYRECAGENGEWHRAFLICTPLWDDNEGLRAVSVQFRKMDRWERVFAAGMVLARARTSEELHRAVVEEAKKLGYPRARVKQFEPARDPGAQDCLRGRASIGLDAEKEQHYRTNYCILRNDDPNAFKCLEKSHPFLFVPETDSNRPSSEFICPYQQRYQDDIVGERHARWIDAPITFRSAGDKTRKWGVLTVDYGEHSSQLEIIDAAELAVFANVVGLAYREVEQRQARFQSSVASYRSYARDLVKELGNEETKTSVLPGVMRSLLAFYQRTTSADIVSFHELRSGKLILQGVQWKEDKNPDGIVVPAQFTRGQGFSACFLDQIDGDGKVKAGQSLQPIITHDATEHIKRDLARAVEADDRELYDSAGLLDFKSSAYIPVVVSDRLRGVISAMSPKPNSFSPQLKMRLVQAAEHAWLGVTLAELHDTNTWWKRVLGNIGSLFPVLAQAPRRPREEAFFAGLGALLTFGDGGLGWNRCLIWSTNGDLPDTAELVYAIGGLGDAAHVKRQEAVTAKYKEDLRRVVRDRISSPPPGEKDDKGEIDLDPLYLAYVQKAREDGEPIRLHYGHRSARSAEVFDPEQVERDRPLHWLLEQDYAWLQRDASRSVSMDMKWEGWLQDMAKRYPGLFCADRAHAFPVWCPYDQSPEPLGIVVVDRSYTPDDRMKERVAATGLVIDLAADILASRNHERRLRGWLGTLPDIMHPVKGVHHFSTVWNRFTKNLGYLFNKIAGFSSFQQEEHADAVLFGDLKSDLEDIKPGVQSYLHAQEAAVQRIAGAEGMNQIEDLGIHLAEIEQHYRELPDYKDYLTFSTNGKDVGGTSLPCDKEIFRDVLHFLVQNAVEAARRKGLRCVAVTVTASRLPLSPGYSLAERVTLRVQDTGPGIPEDIQHLIFLSGFSQQQKAPQPRIKGKGLALARSLLFSCRGDLRLVDRGYTQEESKGPETATARGATFEIAFGIPHPIPEPSGGETNEQSSRRGQPGPAAANDRAGRPGSRI